MSEEERVQIERIRARIADLERQALNGKEHIAYCMYWIGVHVRLLAIAEERARL